MIEPLKITLEYADKKKRYYFMSYFPIKDKTKSSAVLNMLFRRIQDDLQKGVFEI